MPTTSTGSTGHWIRTTSSSTCGRHRWAGGWSYSAVYDLVKRLRMRTGIEFGPHLFRHTYATWLLRRGAGIESVQGLLGHASIATTIDTYGHLTVEDARTTLAAAGWFTGREVRW